MRPHFLIIILNLMIQATTIYNSYVYHGAVHFNTFIGVFLKFKTVVHISAYITRTYK